MKPTEEQLAAFRQTKEQHGDAYIGAAKAGDYDSVFVVRPATTIEASRYQAQSGKRDHSGAHTGLRTSQETMARSVLTYPADNEKKKALLERFPFLCVKIVDKCFDLSGGDIVDLGND